MVCYLLGVDKLLEHYEKEKEKKTNNKELAPSQDENDVNLKETENVIETCENASRSNEGLEANVNITDEEKERLASAPTTGTLVTIDHPFLETIYEALDCTENDYATLFTLSLLYALSNNSGKLKNIF